MSEDPTPYGNHDATVALRLELGRMTDKANALEAALRKEVLAVVAQEVAKAKACDAEIARLNAIIESHKDAGKRVLAILDEERRNSSLIKAEVERLTKVAQVNKAAAEAGRFSYEMVKMEVERLRKAGDAMAICLEAYNRCKPYDGPMTLDCLKSWLAAKEGKPSV